MKNDTSLRLSDESESNQNSVEANTTTETAATPIYETETVIAQEETKAVFRSKLLVAFVMVGTATLVAICVYLYLSLNEEHTFRIQYEDDARKVLEAVGTSLDKSFGALDSMAVLFVSYARLNNQTWPFVTMNDFAVRMAKVLPLTDAININVLPVVSPKNRKAWEEYSVANDQWVNEAVEIQSTWDGYYGPVTHDILHRGFVQNDKKAIPYNVTRNILPRWQNFPVIPNLIWTYNWDWSAVSIGDAYDICTKHRKKSVSPPYMIPAGDEEGEKEAQIWAEYYRNYLPPHENPIEPMSDLSYPIVNDISKINLADDADFDVSKRSVVAILVASMYWRDVIENILPEGSDGIRIVFDNPCGVSFTYEINGPNVVYLGNGDNHDSKYDDFQMRSELYHLGNYSRRDVYSGVDYDHDYCPYTLTTYPSDKLRDEYVTRNPIIFSIVSLGIFVFTSIVFVIYDVTVEKRQQSVMLTAAQSSAIVSSLFPSAVRDRLYPAVAAPKTRMLDRQADRTRGQQGDKTSTPFAGNPIAELYPETTVLFADIAGFTAWSSTRSPAQVFHLLECLYAGFDELARQQGIFKVETIGDCYVAVVGLPSPCKDHAVVMAKFASDCRTKMQELVVALDKSLGPGTADLALRVGLNSGPTTAGVLRGEKSRFQLFGDTVNTAARMESNGQRNRIHVSQKTADLIRESGNGHWLTLREEQLAYKGKGVMTTYWCEPQALSVHFAQPSCTSSVAKVEEVAAFDSVLRRLVDWHVDVFSRLLEDVVKHRIPNFSESALPAKYKINSGQPFDEVKEVLSFRKVKTENTQDREGIPLSRTVKSQLREFIASIASLYPPNAFHNFEHCSHVALSTKKLLDRVAEHDKTIESNPTGWSGSAMSDPLVRFAIVFSALIHDVDHPGVSNSQLVREHCATAIKYSNKCVLEQNSIDIAWNLLMEPKFSDLVACLFSCETDAQQFRQIVVNVVLATDLFDKDLKAMRENRWNKTFHQKSLLSGDICDRRMSIILELIIQVSDVSHTMQHFTIYKKWNMCLLKEWYTAYRSGRNPQNPFDTWYEGELWFFDNYIIPLAQKLRECEVFGASCDEFLDYARDNRIEWELKGREIVAEAREALRYLDVAPVEL